MSKKKALLTFDLEEFDLPLEYGKKIDVSDQIRISNEGLNRVLKVVNKHAVPVTFFTTAFYAEKNTKKMELLADQGHEFGSHLYYHSRYEVEDLYTSKERLQEITKQEILGFRAPRLKNMGIENIINAGYKYDSSLNPTFIPGRYNHFNKPRKLYLDSKYNFPILPFSVSTFLRFPLFWLSFKNLPFGLYKKLSIIALDSDEYIHFYMHPWEFANLKSVDIPNFLKKIDGVNLAKRLDQLIEVMKNKEVKFQTITSFLREKRLL